MQRIVIALHCIGYNFTPLTVYFTERFFDMNEKSMSFKYIKATVKAVRGQLSHGWCFKLGGWRVLQLKAMMLSQYITETDISIFVLVSSIHTLLFNRHSGLSKC